MQANIKNFVNGAELQFGEQPAGQFFGVIAKMPLTDAGNTAEGLVEAVDGEADGTGKIVIEQKEFGDQTGVDIGAVNGFVGVPGAAGAEDSGPFEGVIGVDDGGDAAFGEALVADIEDAGGFIAAFEELAGLDEPPAFIMDHGSVDDADQMEGGGFDFLKEFTGTAPPDFAGLGGADEQINAVELFPEFEGDLVADHAGVFAGLADALKNGIGVIGLKDEELGDGMGGGVGVEFKKGIFIAGGLDNGEPVFDEPFFIEIPNVQEQL